LNTWKIDNLERSYQLKRDVYMIILLRALKINDEDFMKALPAKFENKEIRQTGIKKRN